MKDSIIALLAAGKTPSEISKIVGCTTRLVYYHGWNSGILTRKKQPERCIYDWRVVQEYYDKGNSRQDCLLKFGMDQSSWTKAVSAGYLISHGKWWGRLIPYDQILHPHNIKKRLIRDGKLDYRCLWCGISEWRGERLSLQIDHIDGDTKNNNLDNLRLLCPNCHTQTDTYCGRNKKNGFGNRKPPCSTLASTSLSHSEEVGS